MNLFQYNDATQFSLAGGSQTVFKVECDNMTDDDWRTYAFLVRDAMAYCGWRVNEIEGVPTGGLVFAEYLRAICKIGDPDGMTLIVDDVLTTGGSINKQRAGRSNCLGIVIWRRPMTGSSVDTSWVEAFWNSGSASLWRYI